MAYDRRQSDSSVPEEGGGQYRDYRLEVGHSYAPVGLPRSFHLLDQDRAVTLRAWVECVIPAREGRPSADDVGAAQYIDATVEKTRILREMLVRAIDRLRALAAEMGAADFASADPPTRVRAVRALELEDRSGGFDMVRDLTYEAYYAHPLVLAALERDLEWDGLAPTRGSEMESFNEGLLRRVKTLAPRYREVG